MSSGRTECKHPTCQHSFKSPDAMHQHFLASHSKKQELRQEKYACELCNRSFRKEEGLQDHMRAFHLTSYGGQGAAPSFYPDYAASELDLLNQTMACNDCGKTNFKSTDALHQHQWACANHTRVSKTSNPNWGTHVRACSQCVTKLPTAEHLECHFVDQHPISEVLKSGEERIWQQVEERFRSAWVNPSIKLYKVDRIFKVYNPGWRRKDFEEYRRKIKTEMSNQKLIKEDNLELRNKVLHDGNELQRYHGTTVKCRLGRPPKPKDIMEGEALSLCTDAECSLCRILQTGFKTSMCRITKFQRYGKGIYCSAASSKASAYVKCIELDQIASCFDCFFSCFGSEDSTSGKNNYKVMLVCRVIAGRPYCSTHSLRYLTGPPQGFHSVQGDPSPGKLNYDELVVYEDRAILPAYIVLYTSSD